MDDRHECDQQVTNCVAGQHVTFCPHVVADRVEPCPEAGTWPS